MITDRNEAIKICERTYFKYDDIAQFSPELLDDEKIAEYVLRRGGNANCLFFSERLKDNEKVVECMAKGSHKCTDFFYTSERLRNDKTRSLKLVADGSSF